MRTVQKPIVVVGSINVDFDSSGLSTGNSIPYQSRGLSEFRVSLALEQAHSLPGRVFDGIQESILCFKALDREVCNHLRCASEHRGGAQLQRYVVVLD